MKYFKLGLIKKDENDEKETIINLTECDLKPHLTMGDIRSEVCVRTSGNFAGRSYYLSEAWDWVLGKDDMGLVILVPIKRNAGIKTYEVRKADIKKNRTR